MHSELLLLLIYNLSLCNMLTMSTNLMALARW
jgi:hypothetical protein